MKRRTLFLIQLILLVGLLATLVTQDGISVQAQQIRPQITNHTDGQWIKDKKGWWYKYPDGSFPSKLMECIISSTSTAIC